MTIVSIDYSLTSPALCILSEDCSFQNSKHHYLTNTKKFEGIFSRNIFGFPHTAYKNSMERYENIAMWAISLIPSDADVFLEDYSLGSRKGQLFNIAENTAVLKYLLYLRSIKLITVPPTVVKKFAIKGNASKEDMYEAFQIQCGVDLKKVFDVKGKLSNPITDVVDAYFLSLFGYKYLQDHPL